MGKRAKVSQAVRRITNHTTPKRNLVAKGKGDYALKRGETKRKMSGPSSKVTLQRKLEDLMTQYKQAEDPAVKRRLKEQIRNVQIAMEQSDS